MGEITLYFYALDHSFRSSMKRLRMHASYDYSPTDVNVTYFYFFSFIFLFWNCIYPL